jgi:hypothetical protein
LHQLRQSIASLLTCFPLALTLRPVSSLARVAAHQPDVCTGQKGTSAGTLLSYWLVFLHDN